MSTYDQDYRRSGRRTTSGQRRTSGQTRSSSSRSKAPRDYDSELSFDLTEEDLVGYEEYSGRDSARRSSSSRSAASSHRSSSGTGSRRRTSSGRNSSSDTRRSSSRPSSGRPDSRGKGPRKGGKSKKKKMRKTILIVEIIIILVLALVFLLWMKFGKANWDSIDMDNISVNELDSDTEELLSNYTTLALFGVDNRSNGNYESGNSDTIMIVSINNDTKEVKMISVARDTYLKVTDSKYSKANYAYNHGGAEDAISMLNTNLDLKISGYVAVDFYALATIVDDLGGLELEITQKMIDTDNPETGQNALAGYIAEVESVMNYYPDKEDGWDINDCYFSSAGTYTLNGAQVVGYCRNRYVGNNDFGRAERQREVVKLLVEKIMSSSPTTISKIVDDVLPSVSTSLSLSQVTSLALSASDYEIADSSGFPFVLHTGTYGGASIVVPCTLESNVSSLHEFLYDQEDYECTDTVQTISDYIVNYTGCTESSGDVTQTSDDSE